MDIPKTPMKKGRPRGAALFQVGLSENACLEEQARLDVTNEVGVVVEGAPETTILVRHDEGGTNTIRQVGAVLVLGPEVELPAVVVVVYLYALLALLYYVFLRLRQFLWGPRLGRLGLLGVF